MKSKWLLMAFVFCLLLATLTPLASSSPDGLERVAEDEGFIVLAENSPFEVIANYLFLGIENETLAAILAGWLGIIMLFIVVYGIVWLISRSRRIA